MSRFWYCLTTCRTVAVLGCAICFIGMCLIGMSGDARAAEDQTVIKVAYVISLSFLEPKPIPGHHTGYAATITLSGGKNITEHWTSEGVSGVNSNYHSAQSGLGATWQVLGKDRIRGTWRLVNYSKSVLIQVSGKTCSVSFQTSLDPGQTIYRSRVGGIVYGYTKPIMIDPSCTIE